MNLIFPDICVCDANDILNKFLRMTTIETRILKRANILLLANQLVGDTQIAKLCGCTRKTIKKWRKRGKSFFENWIKKEIKPNLHDALPILLDDANRSGSPCTYTPTQICLIIAIALDKPELSGRPISHWTAREIADEANKRGITKNISARTVCRILNKQDIKPHLSRYWLNPKIENEEEFNKIVKAICDIYLMTTQFAKNNTRVVSVDEKSGMQIIEHTVPNKPVVIGSVEKIEHEYKRNGTLTLIASYDVASGKLIKSSIGPTRNETDFVNHIRDTVKIDPNSKWLFVMDNLNIHMSEELVIEIAKLINYKGELGVKGISGILKSMPSRSTFLSDQSHPIRIQYTPVHCSWLNQIETWFSKLSRKVLRRGSFITAESLKKAVENFILYYNDTMAKPCKWTYTGKK